MNPAISGTPHSEMVRLPERPDIAPEPLDDGFELVDPSDDTLSYALRILRESYREDSDVHAGHKAAAAEREVERAMGSAVPAVYGEILPETAGVMLRRLGALPGHRFYDLGSGTGKVVVLAWLMGMDATGIELVTSRWEASCRALATLRSLSAQPLVRPGGRLPRLRHVLASLTDVDFADADVVFADSALFSSEMMRSVATTAGRLRPGSLLISSDRSEVPSADLRLLRRFSGASSWSNSSVWKVHAAVKGATAGWRNDEVTWGNPDRPTAQLPPGSRVCEL